MPTNLGGQFLDLKYKKNRFIAIGNSGIIVTISNGLNWNQVDSGSTKNLKYIHLEKKSH